MTDNSERSPAPVTSNTSADLPANLRYHAKHVTQGGRTMERAADEIERLSRDNSRLQGIHDADSLEFLTLGECNERLRAALDNLVGAVGALSDPEDQLSCIPAGPEAEELWQAWKDGEAALSGEQPPSETSGQYRASEWLDANEAVASKDWREGWDACLVANRIPLTTRIAPPTPFVVYRSCAKHIGIPWTLSATYTAPPKEVCPICDPPEKGAPKVCSECGWEVTQGSHADGCSQKASGEPDANV